MKRRRRCGKLWFWRLRDLENKDSNSSVSLSDDAFSTIDDEEDEAEPLLAELISAEVEVEDDSRINDLLKHQRKT